MRLAAPTADCPRHRESATRLLSQRCKRPRSKVREGGTVRRRENHPSTKATPELDRFSAALSKEFTPFHKTPVVDECRAFPSPPFLIFGIWKKGKTQPLKNRYSVTPPRRNNLFSLLASHSDNTIFLSVRRGRHLRRSFVRSKLR